MENKQNKKILHLLKTFYGMADDIDSNDFFNQN